MQANKKGNPSSCVASYCTAGQKSPPRIRINYLMSKYRPTVIFRKELGKLLMNVVELDAVKTPEARSELLPNCSTRCSVLPSCSTKCSRTGKEGQPTWESSPIREP